ncbi:type VI secretion system-associated FHA domain protein TagH [Bradyrhizobium jicamae]|uniref:type VI secretion system-associated FHA domain protein TagH n=1 Tax=Bradyrhizobium jicamae TaxID=280332 RepID=UPI001BA4425A|nr:type VI secretion system-associated FHA domain protein TagH [Bradyrhizobium jicamae]MBR0936619.1 type VI secretion system-associated FHA domain protein TagH [Bradyrhizobium jicamae]
MALRLTIENVDKLPDGGPISFVATGTRSIDIGRDNHLDWTLPDPTKYISAKHCEIHCRGNAYWLNDVSTNGTFVNGSDHRVRSPYELKDRDRLLIGHYIIGVSIDPAEVAAGPRCSAIAGRAVQPQLDIWSSDSVSVPPAVHAPVAAAIAPNPGLGGFVDRDASLERDARFRVQTRKAGGDAAGEWNDGDLSPAGEVGEAQLATPGRESRDENPSIALQQAVSTGGPQRPVQRPRQDEAQPVSSPGLASAHRSEASDHRDFMRRVAHAASIREDAFAGQDAEQLAEQLGELVQLSVANLIVLLQARNEAKRLTRTASHTMVQATENNPLKFSPNAQEAMMVLFGPKSRSYLDARSAFEQGFNDLKLHHAKTYAAMRYAASKLIAELDPTKIAKEASERGGLLDKVWSRKSRLWNVYREHWRASFGEEAGAALQAYLVHFVDYYDREDTR